MIGNDYRYALGMYTEAGAPLGNVAVDVDWDPATQWCLLRGLRLGHLALDVCAHETSVHPVWSSLVGEPRVESVRVSVEDAAGGHAECTVPTTYFAALATSASAQLVSRGLLQTGDLFRYEVLAEPRPADEQTAAVGAISVEPSRPPLDVVRGSLSQYARRAEPFGEADDEDMDVFIPREILDEAEQLAHDAGSIETGGFLIGRLYHDPSIPDVFAEVTAQIPARHTRAELTKLTLTVDTWPAVRNAIELRGENEVILGWWHSHSYLKDTCKDCEKLRDGSCTVNAAFMSEADCQVHRTAFGRAYSLALVVADTPSAGTYWSLFGWRRGMIRSRGFSILEPTPAGEAIQPARPAGKGN